jgi:hypothetical protein
MTDPTPTVEPSLEDALVDIRTLARVALQSGDVAVMQRDLEMILTIAEMVLPPRLIMSLG